MATMLSPGVYVTEIDASAIVPTVSNAVAVFSGSFVKGKCEGYTLVTNSVELEGFFGKPTNKNYNDFYQCKTFLDYGNLLLVSRGLSATATNAIALLQATTATVVVTASDIASSNDSVISNDTDFENEEPSIPFPTDADKDVAVKFIAKNPGTWGNGVSIAVAKTADFIGTKYAFDGIGLDEFFEYKPEVGEYAILVKDGEEIVEKFVVTFDENSRDSNNKSMYIETVINQQSKYLYVKDNTAVTSTMTAGTELKSYLFSNTTDKDIALSTGFDGGSDGTSFTTVVKEATLASFPVTGAAATLYMAVETGKVYRWVVDAYAEIAITQALTDGEIETGYSVFSNKEELDIDIVIGNEQNPLAAFNLAENRKDCLAVIGATYEDTVGKKASVAVENLITWRTTGQMNVNSSYVAAFANYINVYDKYSNKNRWINVAGSMAGLRAATNTNQASW